MRKLAVMTAFGALLMSAPAQAELLVSISKAQQRLSITVDGAEAYRWPVSTGRRGYTTPSGSYRPTRLERRWYSRKYQMSPMPWSVFFHRGYAVHGTMEAYSLGRPASHGCVRLRPDNASILFSMVRRYGARHTKLVVLDGPLPRAPGAPPAKGAEDRVAGNDAPQASEHLSAKAHNAAHAARQRRTLQRLDRQRGAGAARARSLAARHRPQIRHHALACRPRAR